MTPQSLLLLLRLLRLELLLRLPPLRPLFFAISILL
jgi:hypothetical protein